MIIGLVPVFIVTVIVMLILNFVHCEITARDSDNKQSLILVLSYLMSDTNPRNKLNFTDSAFSRTAPTTSVTSSSTLKHFKRSLKTELYSRAFDRN